MYFPEQGFSQVGEIWDQWAIFYVSGLKSQSLASKSPKFSTNINHLYLYPHTKISRIKISLEKILVLAHWSHMCGINEPLVWGLWNTSRNPVIFRCNVANSSKRQRFQPRARFPVATQFLQCTEFQGKKYVRTPSAFFICYSETALLTAWFWGAMFRSCGYY